MQDAMNVFQGTPEEVSCTQTSNCMIYKIFLSQIRVRVANADLSVSRGNVEQALIMLRSITPEQPYYIQVSHIMHLILSSVNCCLFTGC